MSHRLKQNVVAADREQRSIPSLCQLAALSLTLPPLAGCAHPPEYSIFGSFFPAWIFCSLGGLLLMTGARAVIANTEMAGHLVAPVLLYLSMAVFLTCILWLLFYS